jgi:cell division protein FtsW (lipid II flippase)
MPEKIVTVILLTIFGGILVILYKKPLSIKEDGLAITKILFLVSFAYGTVIAFIFLKNAFMGKSPSFIGFALMMTPCIFFFHPFQALKYYKYEGSLNILTASIILASIGMIVQYRLGLTVRKGFLVQLTGSSDFPIAFSLCLFTMLGLAMVTFLLIRKEDVKKVIDWVAHRTRPILWLCLALILLILPKLVGVKTGPSHLGLIQSSLQTADFVYKVVFILFLAIILSRKEHLLRLENVSFIEKLKIFIFISFGTAFFVILPLVFVQKELGTTLLIYLAFLLMITITSRRWLLFPAGVAAIVAVIGVMMVFDPHVRVRIIGTWLEWRDYAFKPFLEGSTRWPGWQTWQALSAVRAANIWGLGITNGLSQTYSISNDFVALPIYEEFGIIGLVILVAVYILFVFQGLREQIAPDFNGLMSLGLSIVILMQSFYNLSGTLAILPLSGIPLPFVSNSGVCTMTSFFAIAIMMLLQNNQHRLSEKRGKIS